MLNSIINERADIVQLRQQCARYGQNVAEHPVDSEQVAELPEVKRAPAQPRSDIRSKLDQIEVLLAEIRAALS